MSKTIEKIRAGLDAEPTPGLVMAHVIRLERVVEKLSGKGLDELLDTPAAEPKEKDASNPKKPATDPVV
jgi:hypothetical protein